ncbi:MAG TPA: substrate-binding domain-containing protein [Burkholderiales bacterium]|nr:substrate-binding domain-containing protein [Burkholderiales bacterium]
MAYERGWALTACTAALLWLAAGVWPCAHADDVVKIGGTGTLLGPMQALGAAYEKANRDANVIVVANLGSSGGIRAMLEGAIDIAVNARPLKPAEAERGGVAHLLGRTPFVFVVGAGRSENAITESELVEIYRGSRTRWADGAPVRLSLRPSDDSDNDAIDALSAAMKQARQAAHQRPGMFFAGSDQENADYLERIPGALGGIGLSVVLSERRHLRPLRLDGAEPTAAALAAGKYRLYKPLYAVVKPGASPAARRFLAFVASARGTEVLRSVGIVPVADGAGPR